MLFNFLVRLKLVSESSMLKSPVITKRSDISEAFLTFSSILVSPSSFSFIRSVYSFLYLQGNVSCKCFDVDIVQIADQNWIHF